MAGTVEPKIIGRCPVCGENVTNNFEYWKDEENGNVFHDNCLYDYLKNIGIMPVD